MVEAFGLTHPGLVRSNNEDCFAVRPADGLCVLADGMGGAEAGETASALAVQAVCDGVAAGPASLELLGTAFLEADRRVREYAAARPELSGMGTTLVAALETPDGLAVAAIGDSRCYLYDGTLRLLTSDQTWVNEMGSALGLDEAAKRIHPLRHALTAAVGAGIENRLQIRLVGCRPGELLLLSSDGLHGVIDEAAIAAVLASGGPLEALCQELIARTLELGAPDNVTVVLARF
jgi:protein phosphatase